MLARYRIDPPDSVVRHLADARDETPKPGDPRLAGAEAIVIADALGMADAINLDGGGSTTMVVDGQVINHPSDATGERPVGDAVRVLP